jgi:hypothetical protein
MGMIPLADIKKRAEDVFLEMVKVATKWEPTGTLPSQKPAYPAEVIKFKGTVQDVNDVFFKNGWSLGMPIIPPTPEGVKKMLTGTSHRADEVLGFIAPRLGIVTVEMVAIHATMAGCKPEYIPVLLGITEALVRPEFRGPATTTHPTAPLVIVNGPIRDEIGIAYGQGAAGPKRLANLSIGLTINSIRDIIGCSKAPGTEKHTLGWPGNTIAIVIGENEEANPWGPLHVEKGFKKDENIVSVMLAAGIPSNISEHYSVRGKDLLRVVAYDMRSAGQNSRFMADCDVLVIFCPEHATTLFTDGWKNKDDIRSLLWKNARVPVKASPGGGKHPKYGLEKATKLLGHPAAPTTLLSMVKEPARIQIIVSGGSGKHSQYVSSKKEIPRLIHVSVDKWR